MRRLAILLAASLAACGGDAVEVGPPEPAVDGPGAPPERIGSSGWSCPAGHDVAAFGDVFYPPTHPDRPFLHPRPDQCFSTDAQAEAAGYRLVPPPAGGTRAAGLYLVPPEAMLLRNCEGAARRAQFAVACPGLVPGHAGSVSLYSASGGGVILRGGFSGPPGYEGVEGNPPGTCG